MADTPQYFCMRACCLPSLSILVAQARIEPCSGIAADSLAGSDSLQGYGGAPHVRHHERLGVVEPLDSLGKKRVAAASGEGAGGGRGGL